MFILQNFWPPKQTNNLIKIIRLWRLGQAAVVHVCLSGMYFSTLGGQTYFGKWTREAPVVPSKPDASADQEEREIQRRGEAIPDY